MSKNFMEALKNESLTDNFNISYTENGAQGYATTGKDLLDFNFALTSYRGKDVHTIINDFEAALMSTPTYALKFLFYLRDIEKGIGERRTFRIVFHWLLNTYPGKMVNIVALLPKLVKNNFLRFDDIMVLMDTPYEEFLTEMIRSQINEDIENMKQNKPISLAAKWMYSINTSSPVTKEKAKKLCKNLGLSQKKYRKTLSALRGYIDIVERKMSANQWDEIDYNKVPSKANLIYNNAFLKQDEERRRQYLSDLQNNKPNVKVNAKVCFPHEIIKKYHTETFWHVNSKTDVLLEEMWKELMKSMPELGNMIVVADGSGSMTSELPGSSATNLDVANGFAIACSEHLKGPYKNKYITFSSKPQYVDMSNCQTLREKIACAERHDEISNTNIEKVFDLILSTAVKNRLSQEDIPSSVLIVSDMQFDRATSHYGRDEKALFTTIKDKWEVKGYKLPKLIFLNCNINNNKTIPCVQNENGVILLSGYSINVMNMIISNEIDPWKALTKQLDSERYSEINWKI